jgi:hypothetical protein
MAEKKHALGSPSYSETWTECEGALALSVDVPSTSNSFADEGSCAHEIGEMALRSGKPAAAFIGHKAFDHTCDEVMATFVQEYVNTVADYKVHATDELHVEVPLDISEITGEPDAEGTSDAVILSHVDQEIVVIDLKYGRGVKVSAENNKQLMIYALATLLKYDMIADWKTVRLVISQPRAGGTSEWSISVEKLIEFGAWVRQKADRAFALIGKVITIENLTPGAKQCKWCRGKPNCPALRKEVLNDFENLDVKAIATAPNIGELLAKVPLIEDWCKSVRTEAERRIFAGENVTGYKLVEGKRGNRAWGNRSQIEEYLKKTLRLTDQQMYEQSLITPTSAEKLMKTGVIGARQWEKVQTFITQKSGSPTVAPESDPRPAISPVVNASEEFNAISGEELV